MPYIACLNILQGKVILFPGSQDTTVEAQIPTNPPQDLIVPFDIIYGVNIIPFKNPITSAEITTKLKNRNITLCFTVIVEFVKYDEGAVELDISIGETLVFTEPFSKTSFVRPFVNTHHEYLCTYNGTLSIPNGIAGTLKFTIRPINYQKDILIYPDGHKETNYAKLSLVQALISFS